MNKYFKWSKNGMKMIIDTDFKKFNKQTNYLGSGNVIANTQYSNYIRPFDEIINPVGEKVEKGHLQNFDLKFFDLTGYNGLKEFIKNQNKKVILYEFFVWNKTKYGTMEKDIIGWLIQDSKTNEFIYEQLCGNKWSVNYGKRYNCLEYIKKLLQEEVMTKC